jgi:hypothetical protein
MTTTNNTRRRRGPAQGDALFPMGEVPGAATTPAGEEGTGLYRTVHADGSSVVRDKWTAPWRREKIAGSKPRRRDRAVTQDPDTEAAKPGMGAIKTAVWLLGVLSAAALVVSFNAQYRWILRERSETAFSYMEAGLIDLAMVVCALLAFGLARNGQKARTAQTFVIIFAAASALQNYAAADSTDWRSVLAYTGPPLLLAILVDLLVTTVRRHILHSRGETEESGWLRFGQFLQTAAIGSVRVGLYLLRFPFSPVETPRDLRARILRAAPTLAEIDARGSTAADLEAATEEIARLTYTATDEQRARETVHAARLEALREELTGASTRHINELAAVQFDGIGTLADRFTAALNQLHAEKAAELEVLRGGTEAATRQMLAEHAAVLGELREALAAARTPAVTSPNGHGTGGGQDPDRARRPGESIKAWIIRLYQAHPDAWDRAKASRIATALASETGSSASTARNHIRALVDQHHAATTITEPSEAEPSAAAPGSETPA